MKSEDAPLGERVREIQSQMAAINIDGFLIFERETIRYLTGFRGSVATLFIEGNKTTLLVDGRYTTQAREEATLSDILECSDSMEGISNVLSEGKEWSLGFDAANISYDGYVKLVEKCGPRVKLVPHTDLFAELRARKDRGEVFLLKTAAHIASLSLGKLLEEIRPGVSEIELAERLEMLMRRGGGERPSFDTIVASGLHSALPHARPTSRVLKRGDILVIDYGTVFEGYHSDETCTVAVGEISAEKKRVYQIVKDAHDKALEKLRSGTDCEEVDRTAREAIEATGLGEYFVHGTGHGVGLKVHEYPRLSRSSKGRLEEGMVVTVEPGVYLPGLFGVRIEDTAVVEKDGCTVLTEVSKELKVID